MHITIGPKRRMNGNEWGKYISICRQTALNYSPDQLKVFGPSNLIEKNCKPLLPAEAEQ